MAASRKPDLLGRRFGGSYAADVVAAVVRPSMIHAPLAMDTKTTPAKIQGSQGNPHDAPPPTPERASDHDAEGH